MRQIPPVAAKDQSTVKPPSTSPMGIYFYVAECLPKNGVHLTCRVMYTIHSDTIKPRVLHVQLGKFRNLKILPVKMLFNTIYARAPHALLVPTDLSPNFPGLLPNVSLLWKPAQRNDYHTNYILAILTRCLPYKLDTYNTNYMPSIQS